MQRALGEAVVKTAKPSEVPWSASFRRLEECSRMQVGNCPSFFFCFYFLAVIFCTYCVCIKVSFYEVEIFGSS